MPTDFETLTLDTSHKGVAVVTLNRPDRLNAISWQMVEDLHAVIAQVSQDRSLRVVVLTGAGRGFCAGTDLKAERTEAATPANQYNGQQRLSDVVIALRRMPQPIVCAVNGVAAGGGFSFSMAADIRIAAESARFICSFINVGISAGDVGSSYFLPRLIGFSRAAEMLYTGREMSAEEALAIGYVSRVVPDGQALDSALELAGTMLQKSPFGLRMTKEVLNTNLEAPSLEAALAVENRTQTLAVLTGDFREAMTAFQEKRAPRFEE